MGKPERKGSPVQPVMCLPAPLLVFAQVVGLQTDVSQLAELAAGELVGLAQHLVADFVLSGRPFHESAAGFAVVALAEWTCGV